MTNSNSNIHTSTTSTTNISAESIGSVEVTVELKNSKYPYRVRLAEQAATLLRTKLVISLGLGTQQQCTPSRSNRILRVSVDNCTPGSRWGRMCCGWLGVGWAVLYISWSVEDGNKVVTNHQKKYATSGAIGLDDTCDELFGEHFIMKTAKVTAPKYILNHLRTSIRSSLDKRDDK